MNTIEPRGFRKGDAGAIRGRETKPELNYLTLVASHTAEQSILSKPVGALETVLHMRCCMHGEGVLRRADARRNKVGHLLDRSELLLACAGQKSKHHVLDRDDPDA